MAYQYTNAEIKEAVLGEKVLAMKKLEFFDKITALLDNGYQSDLATALATLQPQLDAKDVTIGERDATIVDLQANITALEAQVVGLGATPVTQA